MKSRSAVVGFTRGLPGHVGMELSESPNDTDEQGGEGDPEPPEGEERAKEHCDETDTEGLHADATLLVVSRGHGAAAGGEKVECAGELGFGGGCDKI